MIEGDDIDLVCEKLSCFLDDERRWYLGFAGRDADGRLFGALEDRKPYLGGLRRLLRPAQVHLTGIETEMAPLILDDPHIHSKLRSCAKAIVRVAISRGRVLLNAAPSRYAAVISVLDED